MKRKSTDKGCPDVMSTACMIWEGENIPCLGICKGDPLSEAETIIANKVCELIDSLDLSKIDITCIADICANCEDKSLKNLIQILYDNQCTLRDLIDNINGSAPEVEVNLNLRCLKKFDDFGNEIPQNLNQVLQSLVNQVCTNTTDIASLKTRVNDLQDQVDDLSSIPPTPVEPQIATCLTSLRPVSQAVPLVAKEVCDIKNLLGSASDISQALSQLCEGLNTEYQTEDGWHLVVSNIAHYLNNMGIVMCNLRDRITLIEENCCAVTCDDITIGFEVKPNEESDGVFIKFTEKAGTKIPIGFEDCGSTIVFTDKNGETAQYDLEISVGAEEGDFDISGLDLSDFINIEVTAKLCAEGISCEKCVSRLYKMNNGLCPYCEITVTGTAGSEVVIIYEDLADSKTKTLVIKAGETGILKKLIKVISVGIIGDAEAESNCENIQTAINNAEAYACYEFAWEGDNRESGSGSWQTTGVTMESIEIGSVTYDIGVAINDMESLVEKIKLVVPSSLMRFVPATLDAFFYEESGDKTRHDVCFSALPSIVPTVRAKMVNGRLNEGDLPLPFYYIYARERTYDGFCQCPTDVELT